jgi:hypothetical protein
MRTTHVILAAMGIFAVCATANAAVLNVTLEVPGATSVTPGQEFTINIYAWTDTGADAGIASCEFSILTPGTVDAAVPKKKTPPPTSTTVVHGWGPKLGGFMQMAPALKDVDSDGDLDSAQQAWIDFFLTYGEVNVGTGGPELVATQTWIYNGPGQIPLEVTAKAASEWYDWGAAGTNYFSNFDTINTTGAMVGPAGEDVPPAATIGGPYGEEDWPPSPGGWNNPARTITVAGTGTDDIGVAGYAWSIAEPTSDAFAVLAEGIVDPAATPVNLDLDISIQDIADALYGGDVGMLPGKYDPSDPTQPDPAVYNYRLKLTLTDTIGQMGDAETTLFVPEPGTLVLLGLGGLGALLRRRRS